MQAARTDLATKPFPARTIVALGGGLSALIGQGASGTDGGRGRDGDFRTALSPSFETKRESRGKREARVADKRVDAEVEHQAEGSEVFLYDLAVRPDRQRRGIGRSLVARLREGAAAQGADNVFVPADVEDDHALELFRALGGIASPVAIFTFEC